MVKKVFFSLQENMFLAFSKETTFVFCKDETSASKWKVEAECQRVNSMRDDKC